VKPWLPVPPSSVTYNATVEARKPDSILNFYKQLLTLRRTEPALVNGGYASINPDDPNVFSFLRHYLGNGRSVLVALNMSDKPQMVTYDLTAQGVTGGVGLMLLNSYGYEQKTIRLDHMTIPPFGTAVIGVK
jgi:glycosidase